MIRLSQLLGAALIVLGALALVGMKGPAVERLLITPANACQSMALMGVGNCSGGGYQGPGDVQSGWGTFYSCRAFSAAKAGTKAYRLQRASDSTQTDINSLASGNCDTSTPATFCNATTCTLVTFYDQVGNQCSGGTACDAVYVSGGQAQWVSGALNGWPCFQGFGGASNFYQSANTLTISQAVTIAALYNKASSTAFMSLINDGTNNLFGSTTTNALNLFFGTTITGTTPDNSYHFAQGTGNGSSGQILVDGSSIVGPSSAGTNSFNGKVSVMNDPSVGTGLNGEFCEGGVFAGSGGTTLNSNVHGATNGWNF